MVRILSAALLILALSGCVLQSKAPLYAESVARLVLGDGQRDADVFSWQDGGWKTENERITLVPEGRHYVVKMKDEVITLAFIPLQDSWHVLQASEQGKPPVYMLAQVGKLNTDVRMLACDDLKKDVTFAGWVNHVGDDCFVKVGAPVEELFKAALAMPGEATTRLQLVE